MSNVLNPIIVYLILGVSGITGALGDIWIYNWAKTGKWHWLVLASIVWVASLVSFGLLLKWDARAFSAAFMLCSIIHIVMVICADIFYFGGRINRLEAVGMIVAIIAVILMEIGRDSSEMDQTTEQMNDHNKNISLRNE